VLLQDTHTRPKPVVLHKRSPLLTVLLLLVAVQCILDLLALRSKHGLDCRAKVLVRKAAGRQGC
jgi:hypothetical protein